MALKAVVASLDDIPEQFHSLYTKVGDEFVLDLDDGDFKAKLSEFRNNNIDLRKKLEHASSAEQQLSELQKQMQQYDGLDAEQARKALEQMQAMEDKKLIDAGKIDELLQQRTDRMRQDYDAKLEAAFGARDDALQKANSAYSELSTVVIDNAITAAVNDTATLKKGAMQDVLARGKRVWKLDEKSKTPLPYKDDGTIMYGKDGENPVTMTEWAQGLRSEAGYLFEGNAGGGAGGNDDDQHTKGVVSINDSVAVSDNLEAIAAGTVRVEQGG